MNELTLCAALGGNPEPQAALTRQPITGRLIRLADSRHETSLLVRTTTSWTTTAATCFEALDFACGLEVLHHGRLCEYCLRIRFGWRSMANWGTSRLLLSFTSTSSRYPIAMFEQDEERGDKGQRLMDHFCVDPSSAGTPSS